MRKKLYQYKRLWLLVLFMAYLLIGFFYGPKVISQQIAQQLSEQLNMQAEMTAVKFNPMTFNIQIHDLKITDAKQQTWFDSRITGINFDPLNLIWGEWNFSELNLVQPKISLVTDETGQVLIPALPEFAETTDNNDSINLTIDQIRLDQARMNIQAGNIKKDFELNIKNIELDHDKFSFADENTHFTIKVTTENNESIALKGHYNHVQQVLNSDMQLIDWQATTMNQMLPDELDISIQAGLIQANGNIAWLLTEKPLLNFSNIEIQALQSRWQNKVINEQVQATLQQVVVNTDAQTVAIERIESKRGDWQLNWPFTLATMVDKQDDQGVTVSESVSETTEPPAWQISIKQISIENWPVMLTDQSINANMPLTINSLELTQFNNSNQSINLVSQIHVDNNGQLYINSEQVLNPLTVNAAIKIKNMSLKPIAPWLTEFTGMVVTAGELSAEQQIKLQGGYFDMSGNLAVTNSQINNQNDQTLASWDNLQIGETTLSSQNHNIILDQITMDKAQGNIIIDPDIKINIEQLNTTQKPSKLATSPNEWTLKIGTINNNETGNTLTD